MTIENFQKIVLEDSKEKLVLVAFWVEQVPESVELKDKLIKKTSGIEQYILMATVDCQSQQQIAMQFGIQGVPTAVLVKDGQPIDSVSGPQSDESIKEFLDKHLPKEQDKLLAKAKKLISQGEVNQAFPIISQAYQLDSERVDIKFVLVDVYIQTGKISDAEQLLATIKMVDQDGEYAALLSKLELAQQAVDSPEIQALEQAVDADDENIELQQKLAVQYSQVNRHEEALTLLFSLVLRNGSDIESRQLLLDVLKSLPDGDPLATKFRRKLYTLLY